MAGNGSKQIVYFRMYLATDEKSNEEEPKQRTIEMEDGRMEDIARRFVN